jgi:malonyl-CoA/methylmalonyl-CoA synthetase
MRLAALDAPGDGPAVTMPEGSLSGWELRAAAGAVARELAGAERVAVWATSELATVAGVLGALTAGVPFVPLNPKLGTQELAHVLADAEPDAVLAASAAALPDGLGRIERIAPSLTGQPDPGPLPEHPDERPALVMYTSGTTGPPKGVVLSRGAIARNLDALAGAWAWTGADVLAHALPLFHVHGLVLGVLGPLRLGGRVRHLGGFDPAEAAAALAGDATMLFGVPTMYHRLADAAERDPQVAAGLRAARLLVSGSAALPAADHDRIERASGQRIVERYGMTETLMITSVRHDGERRAGYVGRPLPGIELRVVDDAGLPVPADDATIGGVEVRGASMFDGYLNAPRATAQAFRDGGWFATGDLGALAPDGYLRLVGRASTDLIKSGGHRIGAGEVESALLTHASVGEAAVLGLPDDDLGERIVAWVVANGEPPEPDALIDHVAGALTPHKRPREIRFVDALPRNAMGKVRKRELR